MFDYKHVKPFLALKNSPNLPQKLALTFNLNARYSYIYSSKWSLSGVKKGENDTVIYESLNMVKFMTGKECVKNISIHYPYIILFRV